MQKIFYLLPSVLMAGKIIASDPSVHPGYNLSDDLGSANQQIRLPLLPPSLPTGATTATRFPIDDLLGLGIVNPPSQVEKLDVNKPSNPSLFDNDLGGVIRPLDADLAANNKIDKPVNPPLFDDDLGGVFPNNGTTKVPVNEETRLNNSTSDKPQGFFSSVVGYLGSKIISCFTGAKNIICFPFKCFIWCCGYDSATTDEKKSN